MIEFENLEREKEKERESKLVGNDNDRFVQGELWNICRLNLFAQ